MRSKILHLTFFLLGISLAILPLQAQPKRVFLSAITYQNGIAYYKNQPFTGKALEMAEDKRTKVEEIEFVNGLKDGLNIQYFPNGNVAASYTYVEGKKNGAYYYKFSNGVTQSEGRFLNEELHGEIKGYYINGNIKYQNNYVMGYKHGWQYTWHETGAMEQKVYLKNGIPDGLMQGWYPDSSNRYEIEYSNGIRNGREYRWHVTGCFAEEAYYKMGKMDSVHRVYEALSCELMLIEFFDKGTPHGDYITFNMIGDTLEFKHYEYGKLHGRYCIWDGRDLETMGRYEYGEPDGYWEYGLSSHFQQRKGTYETGMKIGVWYYYDKQGKLLFKQIYTDEGELKKEKWYK